MTREDRELRAAARIPDARGVVERSSDDTGAVGRVAGGIDAVVMARQHRELRAGVRIPDARGLVNRRGDNAAAVG